MDHNIGLVVSVIFAIGSGRVRPTVYALEIKNSIYQLLTPERIGQSQNEPSDRRRGLLVKGPRSLKTGKTDIS